MKKKFLFIFLILAFLIPGALFQSDVLYYNSLNLPSFSPPKEVFSIWIVLYILIAYVVSTVFTSYKNNEIRDFKQVFLVNYILNISFTPIFFILHNQFLGLLVTIAIFITSVFLFYETYKLEKRLSSLLMPYVMWSFLVSILSFAIYSIN
ncbi:TspO/MBR family protein [Mycoplasmatota bacterium zrk1]